jgi:hypothetical protein
MTASVVCLRPPKRAASGPVEDGDVLFRHHRIVERVVLVIEFHDRARQLRAFLEAKARGEPVATLRTTTSSGMISTSRISCSRMFTRRMKWVGRPRPKELRLPVNVRVAAAG